MAQLHRPKERRPSRMELSPKVAKSGAKPGTVPRERRGNSPFAALNQTEANIKGSIRPRSQSELKRSSRRHEEKPSKATKTGDNKVERNRGFKALKMQSALAEVSYDQRAAIKNKIGSTSSFEDFELLEPVRSAIYTQVLDGLTDVAPTPIQRVAIPTLLGQHSQYDKYLRKDEDDPDAPQYDQFLLAAETGSGKTLAYLLPIIDAIKRAEAAEKEASAAAEPATQDLKKYNPLELEPPPLSNQPHDTTGRPRAIILLPTSELVSQVGKVVKLLSHTIKFRSKLISSAYSGTVIRSRLFSPSGIDVLISTPHLLSSIAESDPNVLSRVSHLVVDEADSLFDRSFTPTTTAVLDRVAPSLKQLILCSATIPKSLDTTLRKRFPNLRRMVTPNLHAIPRRVQLGVVDVEKDPYRGNKNLACADVIWSLGKAASDRPNEEGKIDLKSIIVFVNEREKTVELAEFLAAKGIDAVALNRDTPEQRQSEILSIFTARNPTEEAPDGPDAPMPPPKKADEVQFIPFHRPSGPGRAHRVLPNTKVLVTTDLGSRGIDTLAVRTVLLYDVPHTTIDFIHRLGRTGRMGRRGRGIVLVGKNDRKDVVREVREGMFKGQALI